MNKNKLFALSACALAAQIVLVDIAAAQDSASPTTLEQIVVTGKRANRVSKGATGLPMELKDTPQSISSIDREDMANFGLTGSNEALSLATGITVEQYETNRATFESRGFEIQLTQIDGLGMTNSWGTVVGREDTFLYENIEIIRGANGLLTGVGNASGTINYIRKRPKNQDGGEAGVSFGSWGEKRAQLDYNKVLTQDGSWAGRLVVASEDKNSYIRDLRDRRTSIYGVVDGQIGSNGVLTVGLTAIDARENAPMWGSLTVMGPNGQLDFPVGSSTSQNWTHWNNKTYNAFAEYTHRLGDDWEAKATYNVRHGNEDTKIFYAYTDFNSPPAPLNPDNTGLHGWPYRSAGSADNQVLDLNLSGKFGAFGRQHRLLVGLSQSRERTATDSYNADAYIGGALPAFPYGGDVFAEPEWGPREPSSRGSQRLTRLYAATHLQLTDSLKAVLGVNAVRLHREGSSIYGGTPTVTDYPDTKKTSPYLGLTYDFTPDVIGYVSYSDIFQNQDQLDITGAYLAPMKGVNTEAGVKTEWLGKTLLTTAAVFSADQRGIAALAGTVTDPDSPLYGQSYYVASEQVKSRGIELEATGRLGADTRLTVGYTHLKLTGPDGNDTFEWVARNTFNFRADTRVAALPALRLGLSGRWQSETSHVGQAVQPAYLLANAFASYALSPAATVRLNIDNLADKKYLRGLAYGALYGAPRSYGISLDYKL